MTARHTYLPLFRTPGAGHFFLAGLIARYPSAMVTLGIVIMLSDTRGDYKLPSFVASTCILANALIAPQLSRLADRYGQARVARPAVALAATAFVLLMAASYYVWPDWLLFASAACMGFMPNFGAFSRTRWSHLYGGTPLLRRAFALESLCEELIWMTGPIIVVRCAYHIAPQAGITVALGLFIVGALYFCAQSRTEPAPPLQHARRAATQAARSPPAIFSATVLLPAFILFAFGGFFGILEVAATAFAKQLGVLEKTYYPLTAYAVGSLTTGSLYGLLHWRLALPQQLRWMAGAFALTTLPFCFVTSLPALTLIGFIAGTACSPTIIIALALVENSVDKAKLTESMTWALVSPPIGMAAGFALAGSLVDRFGAQATFMATVPFGVAAFVVAVCAARRAGGRVARSSKR